MRSLRTFLCASAVAMIAVLTSSAVHALPFAYNGGAGQIEHGVYALGAGGAAPFFNPANGQLLQPGGFYPALGGLIASNNTGLQPLNIPGNLTLTSGPGGVPAPAGMVSANTSVRAVNTNNAIGIAATNLQLTDANVNGFASTNTFGGFASFTNVSGVGINFVGGNFMSLGVNLNKGAGNFVAVGVRSVLELYNGANVFQGSITPIPIVFAFDGFGVGTAPDFIQAGQWAVQPTGPTSLRFAAVSLVNLNIPNGWTLLVRGTATMIADPASVDLIDMPNNFTLPNVGSGVSSDADDAFTNGVGSGPAIVPESSSLCLTVMGCLALGVATLIVRRRRTYAIG